MNAIAQHTSPPPFLIVEATVFHFSFAPLCVQGNQTQHTKAQHDPWVFTVVHALLFILI